MKCTGVKNENSRMNVWYGQTPAKARVKGKKGKKKDHAQASICVLDYSSWTENLSNALCLFFAIQMNPTEARNKEWQQQ